MTLKKIGIPLAEHAAAKRYVPSKRRCMSWVEFQVYRRSLPVEDRRREWSRMGSIVPVPAARWYKDENLNEWMELSWRDCCRR